MVLAIILPTLYPQIVIGLMANFILCGFVPLMVGKKAKSEVFTPEHLATFEKVHQEAFGAESKIAPNGLPDQGNGWYSKTLKLADWYKLNSAFRAHLNFIEMMPNTIIFCLAAGLYHPLVSLICVYTNLLGRIFYTFGYVKNANARLPGSIMMVFSNFALLITGLVSCVRLFL